MRKKVIAAALILAAAAGSWIFFSRGSDLETLLRNYSLKGNFAGYSVVRESKVIVKGFPVTEAVATNGENEIKVTIIEKGGSSAANYIDQRLFQIHSQFNRGVSPYPGAISEHNTCPKEFFPIVENAESGGWIGKLVTLAANSRKQFGVCEEKERHYDAAILLVTCSTTGTLFDLTWITPKGQADPRALLKDAVCL